MSVPTTTSELSELEACLRRQLEELQTCLRRGPDLVPRAVVTDDAGAGS
jgi:hypothetical protein